MREGMLFWGAMAMVVYGAANALLSLAELIGSLQRPHGFMAYLVTVRNQADRVEGVVRHLAEVPDSELLLLNLGSDDESGSILERLVRHYEHAQLFNFGRAERELAISEALQATQAPIVVLVNLEEKLEKEGHSA